MFKVSNKNIFFLFGFLLLLIVFLCFLPNIKNKKIDKQETPTNGMLMLIEFEKIEGILQWEKELDNRNLTALVKVQDNVLKDYPDVFKRLSDKGYEIAGGYDKAPFWGMSYEDQYEHLQESKELVEKIIGKKMRVFGSRYFAYDENTLKAANELDIDYILGRGVNDVEAVVYQPQEFKTKVISVSNVDVGEMGRGSLCDYSLWGRGYGATDFGEMLSESISKKPQSMILVSHAYLGGTRLEWWQEYEIALKQEGMVWAGFDDWVERQELITLPNAEISINDEVKYVAPKPKKPMEEYEAIPDIEIINENSIPFVDNNEMKCQISEKEEFNAQKIFAEVLDKSAQNSHNEGSSEGNNNKKRY
jgi:hypothetical protein